ncbi:MAG: hypothetical protein WD801_04540 [Gemmatimonadaceae bacterium]
MSASERPELRAYHELESLVRHLGEELAAFRRRALLAETQLKDAGGVPPRGGAARGDRLTELETENHALRARLDRAEEQVSQMLERVRFLRQQLQAPPAGAGRS